MNVANKDIVDKSISVLISQILGTEPKYVIVMDVTTSFPKLIILLKPYLKNLMESLIVSRFKLSPLKNMKRMMILIVCLLICLIKKKLLM